MDPDPNSSLPIATGFGALLQQEWPMVALLAVLIVCSALAAMTEVAFFTLTPAEIQEFKHKDGLVWRLLRKPRQLLATILIFGNFVNIAIIFLTMMGMAHIVALTGWAGTPWEPWIKYPIAIILAAFIILFFGEVTPKIYANRYRLPLVRILRGPVALLHVLFYPISLLLVSTTAFWEDRIKTDGGSASFEDIKHAIDLTSDAESPEEEKEILKGIVDFGGTMVKSVMRARVDLVAIENSLSLDEVLAVVQEQGYSRMPVYEDNLDNVVGVLYAKDLIPLLSPAPGQPQWQDLVRQPYFIPETKKLDSLLDEFKTRRLHIAIVVDEFGGTSGLVTLEDIIEEIFGEMVDEFDDEEETEFTDLGEGEYLVDGKMHLDDLIAKLELSEDVFDEVRGTADTLAGLLLELAGRIPDAGEAFDYEVHHFVVEEVEQNRIRKVRMRVEQPVVEVPSELETD